MHQKLQVLAILSRIPAQNLKERSLKLKMGHSENVNTQLLIVPLRTTTASPADMLRHSTTHTHTHTHTHVLIYTYVASFCFVLTVRMGYRSTCLWFLYHLSFTSTTIRQLVSLWQHLFFLFVVFAVSWTKRNYVYECGCGIIVAHLKFWIQSNCSLVVIKVELIFTVLCICLSVFKSSVRST